MCKELLDEMILDKIDIESKHECIVVPAHCSKAIVADKFELRQVCIEHKQ